MTRQLYSVLPMRELAVVRILTGYPNPSLLELCKRGPEGWRLLTGVTFEEGRSGLNPTIRCTGQEQFYLIAEDTPGYRNGYSGGSVAFCLYNYERDCFHYGQPNPELEAFLRRQYLA